MHVQSLPESEALGDSMLEEIRRTAMLRLRQIEPLIEEAHRLRDVLEAIEGHAVAEASPPSRSNGGSNGAVLASASPRAPKGANKRIILDLIGQQPGITVAEISTVTGVKRTVVASTVSRLKRHGELLEHEQGGVRLAKPRIAG